MTRLFLERREWKGPSRSGRANRIPLIPQHILKAYARLQATRKLSGDLGFVAVSTSYARGNENNSSQGDGVYYLGPGTSPGYGVVNSGAEYQVRPRVQLFAQVNNLLNHHYYTALSSDQQD